LISGKDIHKIYWDREFISHCEKRIFCPTKHAQNYEPTYSSGLLCLLAATGETAETAATAATWIFIFWLRVRKKKVSYELLAQKPLKKLIYLKLIRNYKNQILV
jgi:hypothetical protein